MDMTYSKVLQKHVREKNEKTIVKSVSEAVRNTIIANKKTQDKETETEFQRSQPTRGGTVWQLQMPANRDQLLS